jgi:phosphatidate phosphatase APP1
MPDTNAIGPAYIELYSGWATARRGGYLYGRVHKGEPMPMPEVGEGLAKKLHETFETLHVNAIPNAQVRLSGFPGCGQFTTDGHGFLKVPLPPDMQPSTLDVQVHLETKDFVAPCATTGVQVWGVTDPHLGVISDIDDTLTDTDVTHKLDLLKNTFFHNTYDVKIFPGAQQAIAAVVGKGTSSLPTLPVFYLSGSPWALHSRISEAFDRAGLPRGATILRRYTQEPMNPYDFKHPHLLEIVDAHPERTWILFGDSGEKDPEVYHTLMEERPDVVKSVFIHNVTNEDPKQTHRFDGFTLFRDWSEVLAPIQQLKLELLTRPAA